MTVPVDRVRIFSRDGKQLTEFNHSVARSWAIGAEGVAGCELPTGKAYSAEEFIEYGNWLLVENSLLPDWVGVIDVPREWSANTVSIYAYTAEHVLTWNSGLEEEKMSTSAGGIFERIIEIVNDNEQTIVAPGHIWRGGQHREETLNPNTLDVDLQRIYERSGEEYFFAPEVDADNQLAVLGNWLNRLGDETEYYLTHGSGGNLELLEQALIEDGPIANDVVAYGEGATWAEKARARVRNQYSINKYGLRQFILDDKKTTDGETLRSYAEKYVREHSNPVRRLSASALNIGNTFDYIKLGNVVNLVLKNSGYHGGKTGTETRARIIGMAYDPDQGHKVDLVIEEIFYE